MIGNKLTSLLATEGKCLHVSYRTPDGMQERLSLPLYEVAACYVITETRYDGDAGGNTPATLRIVFGSPQIETVEVSTVYATAMRHKKAIFDAMYS